MAKIVDVDLFRCVSCYACVMACQDRHYDVTENGPNLRKAMRQETAEGHIFCTSFGCMHCADAPCMAACRKNAILRDEETGLVTVLEERCVGCGLCKKACPLDIPQIVGGKMVKCDGCADCLRRGREPVCVRTCPSGALSLRESTPEDTAEAHAKRLLGK